MVTENALAKVREDKLREFSDGCDGTWVAHPDLVPTVLELAGSKAHAVAIDPEPDMDETWMEPEAFIGCSTQGQAKPGAAQPMHFVRKSEFSNQSQGVSA